jgi:hypothetical protein
MYVVAGAHDTFCVQQPFDTTELVDEMMLCGVSLQPLTCLLLAAER